MITANHQEQISQVNDFSAFLCRRSCKCGLIEIILLICILTRTSSKANAGDTRDVGFIPGSEDPLE